MYGFRLEGKALSENSLFAHLMWTERRISTFFHKTSVCEFRSDRRQCSRAGYVEAEFGESSRQQNQTNVTTTFLSLEHGPYDPRVPAGKYGKPMSHLLRPDLKWCAELVLGTSPAAAGGGKEQAMALPQLGGSRRGSPPHSAPPAVGSIKLQVTASRPRGCQWLRAHAASFLLPHNGLIDYLSTRHNKAAVSSGTQEPFQSGMPSLSPACLWKGCFA